MESNKGVTLIELLIVIVIIGIISAFAIPAVGNLREKAEIAAIKAELETIANAAYGYTIDVGEPPFGTVSGTGTCALWNQDSKNLFIIGERSGTPIDKWKGPYIEHWKDETPYGGCYVYRNYRVGAQSWARSNWYRYSDDTKIGDVADPLYDIEIIMIRFYPLTDSESIDKSREVADYLMKELGEDSVYYVKNSAVIGYYIPTNEDLK